MNKYIKQFKEELMNYKKTRHDNVELFLGKLILSRKKIKIFSKKAHAWKRQVWQLWRETIAAGG